MPKTPHFPTEAELCKAFLASIPSDKWTAYPETCGWDIVLVRKADGFQIGIEAKLRLNAKVITQALERWGSSCADHAGPDCRAVLVPEDAVGEFSLIATYIGLTILKMRIPGRYRYYAGRDFDPGLPGGPHTGAGDWHRWMPTKRCELPEYVPDVPAGVASPRTLSAWKIKAIKLSVILEKRGHLVRSDFRILQVDHRRFLTSGLGWLIPDEDKGGYVRSKAWPNMKTQHPRAYGEIANDYEKWAPTAFDPVKKPKNKQQIGLPL